MTDDQIPFARDYTAIVRHNGKQFTIGDVSLSAIGGLNLSAAGLALVPASIISVLTWPVIKFVFGWTTFVSIGVLVVAALPFYLGFSWDSADKDKPHRRVLLALSARHKQPTFITNQSENTHPDRLQWVAIMQRPNNSAHVTAGRPLSLGRKYRPRPRPSDEWLVHDDRPVFEDWYQHVVSVSKQESQKVTQ